MQTFTLHVLPQYHAEYGVSVTVTPVQALALARKGVINLSVPAIGSRDLKPEAASPRRRSTPSRRRYRRRDLTAQD